MTQLLVLWPGSLMAINITKQDKIKTAYIINHSSLLRLVSGEGTSPAASQCYRNLPYAVIWSSRELY